MAHFTIRLYNNMTADVRAGKIRNKIMLMDFFRMKKQKREDFFGYIVKVEADARDKTEYHLMKTKEGKWLQKEEHEWIQEQDDETTGVIQKAIDNYEKQQREL